MEEEQLQENEVLSKYVDTSERMLLKYRDKINKLHEYYNAGRIKIDQDYYYVVYEKTNDKVLICENYDDNMSLTEDSKPYDETDYSKYFKEDMLLNVSKHKVRNPFTNKKYTDSLTLEEYNVLKEALDNNPFLTDKQKEFLSGYKDLLIGSKVNLEELYNRYADIKIIKNDSEYRGVYCVNDNVISFSTNLEDDELLSTAIHENLHLHQTNDNDSSVLFDSFIEGMTELTTKEYCQKLGIRNDVFSYECERGICSCLCELFDEKKIKEIFLLGDYNSFKNYFISVMGEQYFYEIFTRMYLITKDYNSENYNKQQLTDEILWCLSDIAINKGLKDYDFDIEDYFYNDGMIPKNYIINNNEYKGFEKVLRHRK